MNFTKAFAVFMQIDSKEFTEDEKYEAIQQVLDAATINSITKKQVLNVVSWLFNKQQKYRWHDLRDNPNDLPDANYPSNTWFEVVQKDNEEEFTTAAEEGLAEVVAWREIEEFESEEEDED